MIWFMSDNHFRHNRICEYSNRPFSSIEEMENSLLSNINNLVNETDELWMLGDFCFGNNKLEDSKSIISQIKCKNLNFIKGNHDKESVFEQLLVDGFIKSWYHYYELKLSKGKSLCLFHYPIASWNGLTDNWWHLHGHCHGNLNQDLGLALDVGVDCEHQDGSKYKPFSLDEIESIMRTKTNKKVDHH